MSYKILEDIAIADIAFEAHGKNLEELFESCGLAVSESMVDVNTLDEGLEKDFLIKNEKIDILLFDFLDEIIFLKDAEQFLIKTFSVKIKKDKEYVLECNVYGELLDNDKHVLRQDVKAVTMHNFKIEKLKDSSWKAIVVLDI